MGYTKLDGGITDSTIWQAPDTTRIVWITLLAMSDQNGYVGASVPGLAGRARVPLDACIEALETFKAPDKWSRTKDHDGRRIADADGGWVLLNHAKYRAAQNAEDRRERSRVAMQALRNKRKQALTVSKVNPALSMLTQAEADTEEERKENTTPVLRPVPPAVAGSSRSGKIESIEGVDAKVFSDWVALRRAKKAPVTQTAINGIAKEAKKAGVTVEKALQTCCERGWAGFKAEWVAEAHKPNGWEGAL
jgi:hypothetical protein